MATQSAASANPVPKTWLERRTEDLNARVSTVNSTTAQKLFTSQPDSPTISKVVRVVIALSLGWILFPLLTLADKTITWLSNTMRKQNDPQPPSTPPLAVDPASSAAAQAASQINLPGSLTGDKPGNNSGLLSRAPSLLTLDPASSAAAAAAAQAAPKATPPGSPTVSDSGSNPENNSALHTRAVSSSSAVPPTPHTSNRSTPEPITNPSAAAATQELTGQEGGHSRATSDSSVLPPPPLPTNLAPPPFSRAVTGTPSDGSTVSLTAVVPPDGGQPALTPNSASELSPQPQLEGASPPQPETPSTGSIEGGVKRNETVRLRTVSGSGSDNESDNKTPEEQ